MKWKTYDVDFAILLLREGIKTRDVARFFASSPETIYYFLNLRGLSVRDLRKMSPLPQAERNGIIQEFCENESNLHRLRSMLELYGLRLESFISRPFKRLSGRAELLGTYAELVFLFIRDGMGIRKVAKVFSASVGDVRDFLSSRGISLIELRNMSSLPQEDRSRIIQGFCAKKSNFKKLCLVLDSYNVRYADFVEHSIRTCIENRTNGNTNFQTVFTERNAEIVELRRQGNTLDAIAQRYSITRERVRQIVRRHNKISDNPVNIEAARRLARQPKPELLERRTKIVELRRTGLSYQQIADALGIKKNEVSQCVHTYNRSVAPTLKVSVEDNRDRISDETKNGIIQERENGMTTAAMAKQFGVSIGTVNRMLKESGLTRPQLSARDKEIAELCRQGKTLTVIAKHYNITNAQVRHALHRYNRASDDPIPFTKRLTPQELQKRREKIIELARSGLTYHQIADDLGIEKSYVSKWIQQYNRTTDNPVKINKEGQAEINDGVKREIVHERKKGTKISEIVKKFGVSFTTVRRLLKKSGLTNPPLSFHASLSDRDKEIAELCRQGKTLADIAGHCGLAHAQVQYALRRYNRISDDPIPIELFPVDQKLFEQRKKMLELSRSGSTYQQIADAVGVKINCVYSWIKKYNQTAQCPVEIRKEKRPTIDNEVRNGIIRERKKGTGLTVIAKKYGISYTTVRVVVKGAGLTRPQERRTPISDEVKNEIIQEYEKGMIISAIAKQLGVSATTVKKVLKKAGLTRSALSRRNVLTDRDKEIAEFRRQGKTIDAIASHYGITCGGVRYVLWRYNKISDDPLPARHLRGQKQMERQEKIIELARSGLTNHQIADVFGICRSRVSRLINQYNRTTENPVKIRRREPAKINDELRNEIIRERDKGATITAMAKQFGVSRNTVSNALKTRD